MDKKIVPNIFLETGLSRDYRFAVGTLKGYLENIENKEPSRIISLQRRSLVMSPLPHYQDRFNSEAYINVVTEENREYVNRVNSLIDKVNKLSNNGLKRSHYEELKKVYSEIISLIGVK